MVQFATGPMAPAIPGSGAVGSITYSCVGFQSHAIEMSPDEKVYSQLPRRARPQNTGNTPGFYSRIISRSDKWQALILPSHHGSP